MIDSTGRIYHITSKSAWDAAQKNGFYEAESLYTQGFIHLSKANQVLRVANAIYAGQAALVLLEVNPTQLTADLRYEPPDTTVPAEHQADEMFPHLYGRLNPEAVTSVYDFPPEPDGSFQLPSAITQ